MKHLVRIFLIWAMALAIPLQAHAHSASMHQHQAWGEPALHEATAAHGAECEAHSDEHVPRHMPGADCSVCAACCAPMALLAGLWSAGEALIGYSIPALPPAFMASYLPDLPDRPPRFELV
ncbi:MAG: hypothetical protein RI906_3551 [Pseudomonadota bacterium]|jgi:hypothetical protein